MDEGGGRVGRQTKVVATREGRQEWRRGEADGGGGAGRLREANEDSGAGRRSPGGRGRRSTGVAVKGGARG